MKQKNIAKFAIVGEYQRSFGLEEALCKSAMVDQERV